MLVVSLLWDRVELVGSRARSSALTWMQGASHMQAHCVEGRFNGEPMVHYSRHCRLASINFYSQRLSAVLHIS